MPSTTKYLEQLLVRPETVLNQGTDLQWQATERFLGTPLPSDYKQFISIYGSGAIDGFLTIFNGCSNPARDHDCLPGDAYRRVTHVYRRLRQENPKEWNWVLFPEPGGLLPWGDTDWQAPLFWVTEGDPDLWTVAAAEGHMPILRHYSETMTSFLEGLLSRRLVCEWLQGNNLRPAGNSRYQNRLSKLPKSGMRLVRPDDDESEEAKRGRS
jgi:hypothetical protein